MEQLKKVEQRNVKSEKLQTSLGRSIEGIQDKMSPRQTEIQRLKSQYRKHIAVLFEERNKDKETREACKSNITFFRLFEISTFDENLVNDKRKEFLKIFA